MTPIRKMNSRCISQWGSISTAGPTCCTMHWPAPRGTTCVCVNRFPGGALPGDRSDLKAQFRKLLANLAEASNSDRLFDQALHSLGTQFFGDLKMLPGSQFSAPDTGLLTADTILERSPLTICRVDREQKGAAIEFPGNRVTGPPHRVGMRFVAAATRFAVSGLLPVTECRFETDTGGQRLVREGLVAVVGTPSRNAIPVRKERTHTDDVVAETDTAADNDEVLFSAAREPQQTVAVPR